MTEFRRNNSFGYIDEKRETKRKIKIAIARQLLLINR